MPRKKIVKKIKYTAYQNGVFYVRYPMPGLKYPVWRKCEVETQEAVNEVIEDIKRRHNKLLQDSAVPTKVSNFFAYFLESVKNRISERTLQKYEQVTRLYLTPIIGEMQLEEVKLLHIQNIYKGMTDRGLEPLTVKKAHSVASVIFNEALHLDLILQNPVSRAKVPKLKLTEKIKFLNKNQVKRFLALCQNDSHGTIFEFALETGMRPQEYLALRWSDIDLIRQTAEVTRALVYDRKGGGFYFKEAKTRRSRRTVPLSRQLCEKLAAHQFKQNELIEDLEKRVRSRAKPSREHRKDYNKQVIKNQKELNLVFPSQDFTPFKDINLGRRYFKPLAKTAGAGEAVSLYALRHTCASLLLSANVNPKIVSERLGHSSVALTLDTYSHVLPGMQENATDRLTEVLYQ